MSLYDSDVIRYYAAYAAKNEEKNSGQIPDLIAAFYRDIEKGIVKENEILRILLEPQAVCDSVWEQTSECRGWERFLIDGDSLNDSQRTAIRTALCNPLSVIKGPPGTGKTKVIINLMSCIVGLGKTAAMVSFNNKAVNNVAEKIDSFKDSKSQNAARLYRSHAPLGKKEKRCAFYRSERFKQWQSASGDRKGYGAYERKDINGETYLMEVKPPSSVFLEEYPAVTSTIHSMGRLFCDADQYRFDYVIMDESSQTRPDIGVISAALGKHLVLVGDENQLPSFCDHDVVGQIEKEAPALPGDSVYRMLDDNGDVSFFDIALRIVGERLRRPELITFLDIHYRCHPGIIGFCNREIYKEHPLVNGRADYDKTAACPIRVWYFSGDYQEGCFLGEDGDSKLNRRQLDVFKEKELDGFIDKLKNNKSICVLTPFCGQLEEIRRLLKERLEREGMTEEARLLLENEENSLSSCALTIHKSQGKEFDCVYLLPVEDGNWEWPWSQKKRLINVAVSRARDELVIITSTTLMDGEMQRELTGYRVPRLSGRRHGTADSENEMYLQKLLRYVRQKTKEASGTQNSGDDRYGFFDSGYRSVFDAVPLVAAWRDSDPDRILSLLTKKDQRDHGKPIVISAPEIALYDALDSGLDRKKYRILYDVPLLELTRGYEPLTEEERDLAESGSSCDFVICGASDDRVLAVIEVMGEPHRYQDTVNKSAQDSRLAERKASVAKNIRRDEVKRGILRALYPKRRVLYWTTDGVRYQQREIEALTQNTPPKGILVSSPKHPRRLAACEESRERIRQAKEQMDRALAQYRAWKDKLMSQ